MNYVLRINFTENKTLMIFDVFVRHLKGDFMLRINI